MEGSSLVGKWQTLCIEAKAAAIKISKEIFQKKLNAGLIPEDVHAKPQLNQTFRGQATSSHLHPAIPGVKEHEAPRDRYVYCREDDPIGNCFSPEGEKFEFMQHPSPISDFVARAEKKQGKHTQVRELIPEKSVGKIPSKQCPLLCPD